MSTVITTKEDQMQQQILAAAKRLFQVYGLAKVTMDDVAKTIGKGRSSLYYYYKSKDEIFDAVLTIEIHDMLSAMAQATEKALGVEKKLHAFFFTKIEVLREKKAFFKIMDSGMDAEALSEFQKVKLIHHNEILRQESALLEKILKDAIGNGEIDKISAKDMPSVILVILSSLRGLKRELEMQNDTNLVSPTINALTRITMHGLKK